jgi:opacity protein-like surface antigen
MKKLFLLALCGVLVSASAFAASPIRSIGVDAGYVSPQIDGFEEVEGTWTAGIFADFGLPAANLYVSPFMNYWNSSTEVPGTTSSDEFNLRDFQIGLNLKYAFPTSSVKFQPFIAAGAAAHMLNAEVQSSGLTADEGDTKFGFQGGAGFKVGISERTSIVTSGWYNVVEDADHWSARAGLAWNM